MNKVTIWLCIILGCISFSQSFSQACEVEIPSGAWKAETTKQTNNVTGRSSSIAIEKISVNELKIADLTAGLLSELGFSEGIEVIISIDCAKLVNPLNIETKFGPCQITGGNWDAVKNQLTIDWEIPYNEIFQTSVFNQ